MHMKRALGTITPWELFAKATEIKLGGVEDDVIPEDSDEERSPSTSEPSDAAVFSD